MDLASDVLEIIEKDQNQQAAGGVAPGLAQNQKPQQPELFQSVRTGVMDAQLDHTVGAVKATQKSEMDSKALNDRPGAVGLSRHQGQTFGGATKLPMDVVKEDAAERENSVSEVKTKMSTDPS